jgi:hypothetical protein
MLVILALRSQRQEDCEFKARLDYIERLRLKIPRAEDLAHGRGLA